MKSKIILTSSAIFMGGLGLMLTFFPQEISGNIFLKDSAEFTLILQLLGALYVGFAIQNWFVKGSLIGGIYNKPILMGNILHFTIAAFALLKSEITIDYLDVDFSIVLLIFYALFAMSFFYLTFSAPIAHNNQK